MNTQDAREIYTKLKDNIAKVIVGKGDVIDLLLCAIFTGGHVLLEDVPGTGKTLLTKSLAKSIDGSYNRIQFTPDILPSDITGMNIYNQKSGDFIFKKGPVFTNVVLADEINRATPRSQSALLECMEEKQISIDGVTYPLSAPFLVIATQNPVESQGTFPLPEAQLDRFLMKITVGYPETKDAVAILNRFLSDDPYSSLGSVITKDDLVEVQKFLPEIKIKQDILKYIIDIVELTRKSEGVILGVSPRGSLALMRASQAWALIKGRDYVLPDDVKAVVNPILSHRIICRDAYGSRGKMAIKVLNRVINQVEVPTEMIDKEI